MKKLFKLNIVTPEKLIIDTEVVSLCVPAQAGYLGVLADHAPLISGVVPGKITFRDKENHFHALVSNSGGFLEILNNRVTVLLDSFLVAER